MQRNLKMLLFAMLLASGLLFEGGNVCLAQAETEAQKMGLSDISIRFARNIRLLATMLPDTDTRNMMEVVAGKSMDLARFFQAGGGGDKRRKLLNEEQAIKSKPSITKSDQKRLDDLQEQIKKADPDNFFQKGKKDIGASINELQGMLSVLYSGDPDVKDVIRITQQHLTYYTTAIAKYQ